MASPTLGVVSSVTMGMVCVCAQVHALLTPSSPTLPWDVYNVGAVDPVTMFLNDVMTVRIPFIGAV